MPIDDSGAHPTLPEEPLQVPCSALDGRGWLEIRRELARRHPDLHREQEEETQARAVEWFGQAAQAAGVPERFLLALREGAPDARHLVTVDGTPVEIVISRACSRPLTRAREQQIWSDLRHVVATISEGTPVPCGQFTVHPRMPREIAVASWERDGQTIYACRPGAGPALRRSRGTRIGGIGVVAALVHKIPALTLAPAAQAIGTVAAATAVVTTVPLLPATDSPPPAVTTIQPGDLQLDDPEPDTAHLPADPPSPSPAPARTAGPLPRDRPAGEEPARPRPTPGPGNNNPPDGSPAPLPALQHPATPPPSTPPSTPPPGYPTPSTPPPIPLPASEPPPGHGMHLPLLPGQVPGPRPQVPVSASTGGSGSPAARG